MFQPFLKFLYFGLVETEGQSTLPCFRDKSKSTELQLTNFWPFLQFGKRLSVSVSRLKFTNSITSGKFWLNQKWQVAYNQRLVGGRQCVAICVRPSFLSLALSLSFFFFAPARIENAHRHFEKYPEGYGVYRFYSPVNLANPLGTRLRTASNCWRANRLVLTGSSK